MIQERSKLKKTFLPSSKYGKKSLLLFILFWMFFAIFWFFVKTGYRGGETYWSQPVLSIPFTIAWICGLAEFFTGIYSVIKEKERSVSVFVSILWGGFVLFFILGEIVVPH